MGRFAYDGTVTVDFDDRLLMHLQTVIAAKLRRGESFLFTWVDDDSAGDGRTTIWLHPHTLLTFKYFGKRPAALNRSWMEQLMLTANSAGGLHVLPEPADSDNGGTHDA